MLRLYNTLTHHKDEFVPQEPGKVTLYTCGPTVYSEPHIGNWVAFIRWDILVRTLIANNLTVTRVMNITDVGHLTSDGDEGEDKMQKGAKREGITEWEVAERYTTSFLEGMQALNMLPPEYLARATEDIATQVDLVKKLDEKGYAYVLDDGVYFDTSKFPTYADFANLNLETQKAGARVSFNTGKKNIGDFVLWRFTPEGEVRNMEWDSPWGRGIPGWHLECSAMAMRYLGSTLDIHTGGIDHIPVHHTNEIAQSEAVTGKRFSNYWLHNAHLLSNGTKLSKSLNNSYTLSDIEQKGYSPMSFRMFLLQSHYRTETNFTFENLVAAKNRLQRWQEAACLRHQLDDTTVADDQKDQTCDIHGIILAAPHAMRQAINDDLNTPEVLTVLERVFDALDTSPLGSVQKSSFVDLLAFVDDLLGLKLLETTPDIDSEAKRLLLERAQAREDKNWELSDSIRKLLIDKNIGISDTPYGTRWFWN